MPNFNTIYKRAADRHGGEKALHAMLPDGIASPKQIAAITDDRFLSAMTKAIFKAGFVWRVIETKWPGFEEAFWNFHVQRCNHFSPDDFDALIKDTRIVRNPQKIQTVPANAAMIAQHANEHGSFAAFIANWPDDDYVGLLAHLKKHGSRLGGNSCQYFLRTMGKDGFILGRDGIAALIAADVVDKTPTSKTNMKKVQEAYNAWRKETGYNLAQISRILALSIDAS